MIGNFVEKEKKDTSGQYRKKKEIKTRIENCEMKRDSYDCTRSSCG